MSVFLTPITNLTINASHVRENSATRKRATVFSKHHYMLFKFTHKAPIFSTAYCR